MKWICPAGCKIDKGVVCGGDYPAWIRTQSWYLDRAGNILDFPNAYFLMDLKTGRFLKEPFGFASEELVLNDSDWPEMFEHADNNGCGDEPQCPRCLEFLVEVSNGKEEKKE